MRGKRWFAALAASALGLGVLAVAGTPAAQAAPTVSAFCAGNGTGLNGNAGTLPDPTTVQPNCSITAAISTAGKTSVGSTVFLQASSVQWVRMTITGDSTWDDTNAGWAPTARPTVTNSGKTITLPASYMVGVTPGTYTASNDDSAIINVPTAGVRTVTVETSTVVSTTIPANNQFSPAGDFTVTGLGGSAKAIVSQGYYAVNQFLGASAGAVDDTAALALIHIVDEAGNVIPTTGYTVSGLTFNNSSGTVSHQPYRANDCLRTPVAEVGELADFDPGNTAAADIVTDACAAAVGAGVSATANSGVWVTWAGFGSDRSGTAAAGTYSASFNLNLPNGSTYPVTVNYVVSSPVAIVKSWSLDKSEYGLGTIGIGTASLTDLGGRVVPDGLGWFGNVYTRSVTTFDNNPLLTPATWAYGDDSFATYNGENFLEILMPPTAMERLEVGFDNGIGENAWASTAWGETSVATARVGDPRPPLQESIMIEGTRGVGDDANRVYVEGTTTNLVGKSVTPYFRFPGETGFTAGTGTRTVDAQGNFNWQRKTGKKIAVQFRAGDGVVSNTIIIEAK